MFDYDEIMKHIQKVNEQTQSAMDDMFKRSEEIAEKADAEAKEKEEREKAEEEKQREAEQQTAEQQAAGGQRQVEILGQMLGPDGLAQMAYSEEQMRQEVERQVSQYASMSVDGMMEKLFGEDMGVISAALETLAMEEDEDEDEEEEELDLEDEQELYRIAEVKMAQIGAMPEPEPVPYSGDDPRWAQFGILLSGIVSFLNGHDLDSMDVEEHIPVLEQQVASVVRRSWGIDGRGGLLDTIRYLTEEGYVMRYRMYCEASSPEELLAGETDEEECASVCRGWRFAQHFKDRYAPEFMLGWDIGRAAMLARWGCYLGWLTRGEAEGILWDLTRRVKDEMHSWREFAQSYLFGGLMWKLLCGDSDAETYLSYIADAAVDLLTGGEEQDGGQWKACPWPERRRIGF